MKTLTYLPLLCATLILVSCGEGSEPKGSSSKLKKIFGSNDLVVVPESGEGTPARAEFLNAIGKMKLGCTVTHIGNGYAITAGHCLASASFFGPGYYRRIEDESCNSQSGSSIKDYAVVWGNRDGYTSHVSSCQKVLVAQFTDELDYAILKFNNPPSSSLGLHVETYKKVGDRITIFSHPRGRELEWSGWCKVTDYIGDYQTQFTYFCDTEPGSSGAAVVDENGKITGIHNGGKPNEYNYATFTYDIPLSRFNDLF